MPQVTIFLKPSEKDALRRMAELEFRDIHSQAALIIRQALNNSGLLSPDPEAFADYKMFVEKRKVGNGKT